MFLMLNMYLFHSRNKIFKYSTRDKNSTIRVKPLNILYLSFKTDLFIIFNLNMFIDNSRGNSWEKFGGFSYSIIFCLMLISINCLLFYRFHRLSYIELTS